MYMKTQTKTIQVQIQVMTCPNCGYQWEPRVADPKRCPDCQTKLSEVYSMKRTRRPGTKRIT